MDNIKPYLALYNVSEKPVIENNNFQVCIFEHNIFNQDLCQEILDKVQGNVELVIIDAQAQLPLFWFERLSQVLRQEPDINICSALSCRINALSPLTAGDTFAGTVKELDNLIYLLQIPGIIYSDKINPQCFILRDKYYLSQLDQTPLAACNNLLVQSQKKNQLRLTDIRDIGNQKPLPAHPLAELQWRLKPNLSCINAMSAYPLLDDKPIMLHINMGWGGGIHQWINDFCRHEKSYHHVILSSDGELYRQTHGETLRLHYQQTTGIILQRFDLQSPIKATCIAHPEYKQILDDIIKRYHVQQIIVSSLIGHSMECLQTDVATIRVLHDYFPSWPSLIANLDQKQLTENDIDQALAQTEFEPFGLVSKETYNSWCLKLHQIYQKDSVKLVAPSRSVVENLQKIDHSSFKDVAIIPHAIESFKPITYVKNNGDFKILVLGRINPPKGQKLLEDVIDELGESYHFIFIGAGNEGKKYLNTDNITVIMDYDNKQLPQLLQNAQADLALITSQTSETFNYTLSELQQAGICTISTKYGALKDRISDGKTGFLCDDNATAITKIIRQLKNNPDQIKAIRNNLQQRNILTFKDIITKYQQWYVLALQNGYQINQYDAKNNILAMNLHELATIKRKLEKTLNNTESTLTERTKWGQTLTKELKKAQTDIELERKETIHIAKVLKTETTRMNAEIDGWQKKLKVETSRMAGEIKVLQRAHLNAQDQFERTNKQLQQTVQQLDDTQVSKEKVAHELSLVQEELLLNQQELSSVYQSRSWRVTKPIRTFTTWARHKRNAVRFRLAQLKTFPMRVVRSVKTRGVSGTAKIVKTKLYKKPTQTTKHKTIELTRNYEKIAINKAKNPIVSIIIPVFNHFEHTYNCLKSIAKLNDETTYEVIVVDDCSTDETPKLIKNIKGISYQRQKTNGGFIESCNTGAKLAKGQYLMFLNNDTVVYDNWLDSLCQVFDDYPDAGLVGSKLVYPDNQLQEAGGIVFSDASGWNYGRLGKPDEPWYNHIREVDYCSGASILITNALFVSLGYFDERYKPAYYEDTDLAFAVRNIGKKVYYQPASKITHFEGISSGTDLTSGMKKYQVVNQTKFKQKWVKQLANQPKVGTEIELCRIHAQPKRILIFDACTPTPDQDSGSLRMTNLIKILKELEYHVIFMPENLSYNDHYTQALQQLGVECIYTPTITNPIDYLKEKGKFLDVVMLSRYYVAQPVMPFIRDYCPKAQIVFDTVDLHYVRERRMAELAKDKKLAKIAEETRIKELGVAKACDVTLVVSPYEVEVLAQELPKLKVKILTNIHQIYGCRKPFSDRKDIMFIGGYQHTPNVDAIEWFVKDILPLIIQQLPDLKFHIIGSKAPKHIKAMASNNIIFQGFVEDIEPVMDDIRIAIAPLRYGAGVKGKVNMSMSYGQPVVGTKVAVEGMFTVDEKDCLMAETPEEFANQVIRLYQDEKLWNQISQGGLRNVENYFSFEAAKKAIENILK
jgi:GT2 family glycosyltransferase